MEDLALEDILMQLTPEGRKEWENAVLRAENKKMKEYILSQAEEVGQKDE